MINLVWKVFKNVHFRLVTEYVACGSPHYPLETFLLHLKHAFVIASGKEAGLRENLEVFQAM